mmetsp:Transcript_78168/g.246982  ORF Transcript_78168/g.246982 Transcript_78168/m.246982 type:complete len:280 (-) Transcript_78168:275-1114(-)
MGTPRSQACCSSCPPWQYWGFSHIAAAQDLLLSSPAKGIMPEAAWACEFQPLVRRADVWGWAVARVWDAADALAPPPEAPLLLYGSSILRLWGGAAEAWAPLPTLNRAFGGSRTWEALRHFGRGVARYRPRVIVLYCGSKDVNFHAGPLGLFGWLPWLSGYSERRAVREIAGNVAAFVAAAGRLGAQVVVCSIIRSPQKRRSRVTEALVGAANDRIRAGCEGAGHAEFVDLNPFLEEGGRPLASLYLLDGLHYRREAYGRIHAALREAVARRWALAGPG